MERSLLAEVEISEKEIKQANEPDGIMNSIHDNEKEFQQSDEGETFEFETDRPVFQSSDIPVPRLNSSLDCIMSESEDGYILSPQDESNSDFSADD
ncbi:hypothetical protein NPIL_86681 [Nephila pilipes]|uniref:Uncharacterized protein n=1 Tax=Nephila pilipes TaxID=299642 RepID=A0A8X6PX37_NEPPI|nr:hypothetical protein NPIL_86681 [Nephila pilipes]